MTTAKLLQIPAEILACIADELDIEHYGNLRLANRQVHDYTFPYFAKKFFGRRKFFRDYLSLSTLRSISESRLSPYLETLILSIELLQAEPPPDDTHVSKEAYYKAYADQTSMLASGWDRDTLVDALRNLPNLKGVGVESYDDRETWDLDGNRLAFVVKGGYGLKTLFRSLGFEEDRPPNHHPFQGSHWVTTVQMLLSAVAKTEAKPKSFAVIGNPLNGRYTATQSFGVDDDAFNIPEFLEATLVPVIEELHELDLEVYNKSLYPIPDDPATIRTCHLRRFLGLPKKLEKLRIARLTGSVSVLENQESRGGFWTWLGWSPKGKGKATVVDDDDEDDEDGNDENRQWQWDSTPMRATNPLTSPPPISLAHLRELHLAKEDILCANLTRLINKVSPTLVRLDLHDLNLRDRDAELLAIDHNDDEPVDETRAEVNLWIELVGKLAAMPLEELREVNITGFGGLGAWHLTKFGEDIVAMHSVHFKVLKIVDIYESQAEFSYKGPDVRGALRQLQADLRAALRDGRHVFFSEPSKRRNSF